AALDELTQNATTAGRAKLVVARRKENAKILRDLAAAVRDKLGQSIVILGTASNGESANLVVATSKDLGVDAREVLRAGAVHIEGGGGGTPELASGGGRKPAGLEEALAAARSEAERLIS